MSADPSDSRAVRVRAPGKINLYLGVGDRHDDGYHALATVFQAVSLWEDVVATAAARFSLTVTGVDDPGAVPLDDRNLAMRAAKLLAAATGYDGGVRLEIHKTVPVAGGMGGGSADAAATLVACNELWGTALPPARLHELAARLGADVPFALQGGVAIGTGRGDVLTPALSRGRFDWVLVPSPYGMSTPAVYARLDAHRDAEGALADDPLPTLEVPPSLLHALLGEDPRALADELHNDLQVAALLERPDLQGVIDEGIAAGALRGIVSGSGPTIALLCASAGEAVRVRDRLLSSGRPALLAQGPVSGAGVSC